MAWGILEDYQDGTAGTTLLSKKGDLSGDVATNASVKKVENIVLFPQPSDSVCERSFELVNRFVCFLYLI